VFLRLVGEKKLTDKWTLSVFQGIGKSYWTVSLDIGWFGAKIVISQLSRANIHSTKALNQSIIARFHLFSNYLIHSKIAIVYNKKFKY